MDRVKNVVVNVTVTCCNQNAALDLEFILFAFLLFLDSTCFAILLGSFVIIKGFFISLIISLVIALRFFVNFDLVFFFLLIGNVKSLQDDAVELLVAVVAFYSLLVLVRVVDQVNGAGSPFILVLLVLVRNNFYKSALLNDLDAFTFKLFLRFFFEVHVIKGILVNDRHVFCDLGVAFVVDVAFLLGNGEHNVFVLNTSVHKTLNSSVDIECSSVYNTFCLATTICELLHERA